MRKVICVKCGDMFETERVNGTHCGECIRARYEGRANRGDLTCHDCGTVIPRKVGKPAKRCETCRERPTEPCSLCGTSGQRRRGRLYPYCDTCLTDRPTEVRQDTSLRRLYGLTLARFDEILLRQGGGCGICGREMESPCVDHDHVTGDVRGLLCQPCNTAIGLLGDTYEAVMKAAGYLKVWTRLTYGTKR